MTIHLLFYPGNITVKLASILMSGLFVYIFMTNSAASYKSETLRTCLLTRVTEETGTQILMS